jgi:hypothetical protein
MLKIVNQTTYEIEFDAGYRVPESSHSFVTGVRLQPNQIAAYRVDNAPGNYENAANVLITTYIPGSGTNRHFLEYVWVPGNATVVFATQILTGLLQPGS